MLLRLSWIINTFHLGITHLTLVEVALSAPIHLRTLFLIFTAHVTFEITMLGGKPFEFMLIRTLSWLITGEAGVVIAFSAAKHPSTFLLLLPADVTSV